MERVSRRLRRAILLGVVAVMAASVNGGSAGAAENGPILFSDYTSIWKVQPDGSGLKRVAKRAARSLHVSPNGKTLLYTHGGLFKMPMKGGKSVNVLRRYPVVSRFAGVDWASWSPNGRRIAFAGSNDSRIYVINANGRGLKYLFRKYRTGLMHPVWSPDGREIAYIDVNKGSSLMAVTVKTGKTRMIYPGSGPAGTPVDFDWHPDGSRLAFYAPYRNWMINRDGTGLREISSGAYFDSYEELVFSPDGKELVGQALRTGGTTTELWRLDGFFGASSGGFVEEITGSFSGSAFYPEWAPRPR